MDHFAGLDVSVKETSLCLWTMQAGSCEGCERTRGAAGEVGSFGCRGMGVRRRLRQFSRLPFQCGNAIS